MRERHEMELEQADGAAWLERLQGWARELGFSQIGVAGIDLQSAEPGLQAWLEAGFHGSMAYMQAHGLKRARPAELVPGTVRVITARMDYLPAGIASSSNASGSSGSSGGAGSAGSAGSAGGPASAETGAATTAGQGWQAVAFERLQQPRQAVISLYAQGRDYHKVMRARLQKLADRLQAELGVIGHRVFTDSAPVLEVELAQRSGIGWRGKHTLVLSREAGSMFFLGEIYVDLPLPLTTAVSAHCGQCEACISACPTGAIVAPYRLDARRCISYLTIEQDGPIPIEFRRAMGNRIYGCDDCQLACPWNKFAGRSSLPDFDSREAMSNGSLVSLWQWDEATFLKQTEGSAIRRIGIRRWRRNIAVALGNAWRETGDLAIRQALEAAREASDEQLREHIDWALMQRTAHSNE